MSAIVKHTPPIPLTSRQRQMAQIDANIAAGLTPLPYWREQAQIIRAIIRREMALR